MAAVSTRYDWTYPSDYYLSSTTSLSLPPPLGCWPATCGKAGLLFIKLSYPMTKLPVYMLVKNAGVVAHKPRDHYRFTLKEERNETNSGNSWTGNLTLFSYFFLISLYSSLFFHRLTAKSLYANGHWSVFLENETHMTLARTRVRAYLGKRAGM